MRTVRLRSRVGPVEFTRRTMIQHPNGNEYLAPVTYRFCIDNNFTAELPRDVWEDLAEANLGKNLKYREALIPT